MHIQTLSRWKHSHKFNLSNRAGERNTRLVIVLTGIVMIVEIITGLATNSMALLADGWHMSTHLAALTLTAIAYAIARRHENDKRYTFGTGKVGVLGGYSSAIFLGIVALAMAGESLRRFFSPLDIDFDWAIRVAVIGLVVNLVSAVLLKHGSHGHEHDHNLKAAYLHVLADALTSFTAIFALLAGKYMGWVWMDPLMGVVGAIVICIWAYGLLRATGTILLDYQSEEATANKIQRLIEADSDNRIADLHLWRVSDSNMAAIISLVTHFPRPPQHYKSLLDDIPQLSHVTVEVITCHDEPCIRPDE